jgi:tripartite-type tricarboxylate transporter receptor subunit TctC
MNIKAVRLAACVALSIALPNAGFAQDYPTKAITIVAPQKVGGAADLAARSFAVVAEKYIGQPIRVVNKGGGAGVPGVMQALTSKADGYTLLLTMAPHVVSVPLFQKDAPFSATDLDYLTTLEDQPLALAVPSASPYTSFEEFVAAAQSGAAPLRVAVVSRTSLAALLLQAIKLDISNRADKLAEIPFQSGPDQVRGLLAGDVDAAMINLSSINGALASGDARLLMVTSSNRNAKFPDVPTAAELNLPRADGMTLWMGLAAHKDVPDTVAAAWAEALPKVFADPEYKGLLSRRGADLVGTLPDQTNAFVAAQVANMVQLKAAIGY